MNSVTQSILINHNGVLALEKLIAMKKLESPHFSKSFLAKKVGLSSRAYLTDIFKERKKLSARYVRPIVESLDLANAEAVYLEKKLLLETEFVKTHLAKTQLQTELQILEKKFRTVAMPVEDHCDVYALSLVYLSFFLFKQKQASRRDLYQSLALLPAASIDMALHELRTKGLLIEKGYKFSVNPEKDFSFLNAEYSANSEMQFLKKAVEESVSKVELLKSNREEVIFQSTILTVKKTRYLEFVDKVKLDFRTMIAGLDDEEPDSLIRFNIQLYPISMHSKPLRA